MSIYPLRIIKDNTKFDFVGSSRYTFAILIFLLITSVAMTFVSGLNLGIDFKGGVNLDLVYDKEPDLENLRAFLGEKKLGEILIQSSGKNREISVKIGVQSFGAKESQKIIHEIKKNIYDFEKLNGRNVAYSKTDFVGPQIGKHLMISGFKAVLLSFLMIMVYIWFRFEWQFGIGVIIVLFCNTVISIGFMSVSKLDFNLSSIAGILTIIGYSVNDCIVIYDRIRDSIRRYKSMKIDAIINISINDTLSRTSLTVITTLMANLALIVFGGEAIKSFSLLVFVGVVVGTFSSIFISGPMLLLFKVEKFK